MPRPRTARVEPGVVLADLQRAAGVHDLRFGPDPSTLDRCTLGGMIGNNACGPHAVAYGKTADNVVSLDWLDGRGRRYEAATSLDPVDRLDRLVASRLSTLRTELGRFSRQVSGYSLEHLLPEKGNDLAKALVGTEGTCGLLLGATVSLVPQTACSGAGRARVRRHAHGRRRGARVAAPLARWRWRDWTRGSSRSSAGARVRVRFPTCLTAKAGCSSRSGATPSKKHSPPPQRWSPMPARRRRGCCHRDLKRPHCGGSGPTVPVSRDAPPTVARPGRAGRTRPSHPTDSVPTSAISTR